MAKTVEEVVDFIYHSYNKASARVKAERDEVARNPRLCRRLLDMVGSPDRELPVVAVTGSKGKGSTARMIAKLLEQKGLKVGLFTSPHLVKYNERIRINGTAIQDKKLLEMANLVKPYVERLQSELNSEQYLGPVGISLAIACTYFAQQKTQVVVLECGRGGRYDDVAAVENHWAVITPVMMEHANKLGSTLIEIAKNKVGIVSQSTKRVFVARQAEEVNTVIEEYCKQWSCSLDRMDRDFSTNNNIVATVSSLASYQVENGAVALATAKSVLEQFNLKFSEDDVKKSFEEFFWPGRCQLLNTKPRILLDGAVTRVSAQQLKVALIKINITPIVSIIGVPMDKEYREVFKELASVSRMVVATESIGAQNPFPEDALDVVRGYGVKAVWEQDFTAAIATAKSELPEGGLVCVAGTQSLIGAALNYFAIDLEQI